MAREMKDSGIEWIGEMPREWELVQLRRFVNINNGREIRREVSKDYPDAIGVYGSGGIFKYTDEMQYSGKAVMFGRKGTLGKPLYVDDSFWTVDTMYFLTYMNGLDERFNYYQLIVFDWEPYITHTAIPSIVASQIVACHFPIPNRCEQNRIAAYLDRICVEFDNVLEKTRASIEEYKKLKQAVITQAVTKGVRGDREMKESGIEWIGEIPKEWHVKKLRYLGGCQNGISKSSEYFGEGYPFVSYGDVYRNYQLPETVKGLIMSTESDRENYSVIRGDVLFTRTSETIEEVGFSSVCLKTIEHATFAGFVIRFRPNSDELLPEYSKYYFRSDMHRRFFAKEMNLVTRASLGQELLKRLPVALPSLQEQKEIANYLEKQCGEIDGIIAKKKRYIMELESYRKSLIYEYVTGKKEVPRNISIKAFIPKQCLDNEK